MSAGLHAYTAFTPSPTSD